MSQRDRRNVVVLGSTGSIGRSTLDVVASLSDRFQILALAASRSSSELQRQIDAFRPALASCGDLGKTLSGTTVVDGPNALTTLSTLDDADIIVVATTGHASIVPTIEALKAGKIVALANKEAIVAAGEIVTRVAREWPGHLRPVDSEHSALWQCLGAPTVDARQVSRLILTASGGPFRGWTPAQLATVTPDAALKHPTWSMGSKITVDSATLMNKGLEMIEAHWLFDCPLDRIDVVVHPQSIVHSFVEYVDGSMLAHLASHDMRIPIQYALTYPDRVEGDVTNLRATDLVHLDFEIPDHQSFPALRLARQASTEGATFPTVLSTADSIAVDAFLQHQISFPAISQIVEEVLEAHAAAPGPLTLDGIASADEWASAYTTERIVTRMTR